MRALGVTASSFGQALDAGKLNLPDVIRRIGALGVRQIELMDTQVRPEDLDILQCALNRNKMTLVSYALFCDVDTPSDDERKRRTCRFHQQLKQAAQLGAPCAMVIPGVPGARSDPTRAREWFREALMQTLPFAAELGLTLTVENLGFLTDLYGRSRHILSFCQEVGDELKVTFDAGNCLLAGEDSVAALERLWPRVEQVHMKDWRVVPDGTPCAFAGVDGRLYQGAALGEGLVGLGRVTQRLKELGYSGPISVEYEGPDDPLDAIGSGLNYLSPLL